MADELNKKKSELEKCKGEFESLKQKMSDLRKEIKELEGKPTTTPNYEYTVKRDELEKLCNRQVAIGGVKELFDRALTIKDPNSETPDTPIKLEQYSVRVRNEGMRIIKEYCMIEKKSPRVFYIRRMKSDRSREANRVYNDKDIDMIDSDIKLLDKEIELSERKHKLLENQLKLEQLKNGNK